MHFPNPRIPISETLGQLGLLFQAGKIRAIGSPNFAGWQIADAEWAARTYRLPRFISAQNRYNLLERDIEQDVLPACRHFGVQFIPFYPLAAGMLTGKYRRLHSPPPGTRLAVSAYAPRYLNDGMFDRLAILERLANKYGVSLLAIALGGLTAIPGVSALIVGATSPEQVHENAAASRWRPGPAELREILQATDRGE